MSITLLVVKEGKTYDMSTLVEQVQWNGRKGAASRTLAVSFIDDEGHGHARTEINIERGDFCVFSWKGKELFRGMFMRQEQSSKKTMSATAYDIGIYLANNKDTFHYTNMTASNVFIDCCKRFGIPYGAVTNTVHRIPELTKPRTTVWDVICDALSMTFKATGRRYYPFCAAGKVQLLARRENILQWVLETGVNMSDYSYVKSIERVKTRIKLLSSEGNVLAQAVDAKLEQKIGVFQDIAQPNEELNSAQLKELAKTTLSENNEPERHISVTALGIPDVITGMGVFVSIKALGITKTYYVEEDAHSFDRNVHTMRLKLVLALDTDTVTTTQAQQKPASSPIKTGEMVRFSGGYHYVSSIASSPRGGRRRAGNAKCTIIAKGARHPYHLIGTSSNVWGWVDADTVSKQ